MVCRVRGTIPVLILATIVSLFFIAALSAWIAAALSLQSAPDFPLLFASDFENGRADGWSPGAPDRWRVAREDGSFVYQLIAPGEFGPIRAPTSWSIVQALDLRSFVFTGRLKCKTDPANNKRDMCIIFGFQDPTHFYYVHFSASSDDLHNIIGLVNGADRIKINREPAGGSVFRLTDMRFHEFKVTSDAATGEIKAYLDDMARPILTASDKTFVHGRVGVGSFDDTGSFDDLKIWGEKR
jgi:hypothetical protein